MSRPDPDDDSSTAKPDEPVLALLRGRVTVRPSATPPRAAPRPRSHPPRRPGPA